ncbi:hypothetical protein AB0N05_02185 [Nocardia sp. NPDC051030]|uniref:DUF6891 domain-containing protein n=1 Tax=Nocardia sp. NPDC051030 TaxID=3155162 RepID=UPI00341C3FAF
MLEADGDHKNDRDESEALTRLVREYVLPGFMPLDTVLEYVREWVEQEAETTSVADAEAFALTVWHERLAEQENWTGTGDYDRLAAAFADLAEEGILGRMNFACCTNCATGEIDDERTEHPNPPDWYRYREWAYVYFHEQNAARLTEPGAALLLGYSAFRALPDLPQALIDAAAAGDEEADAEVTRRTDSEVGRHIVAALVGRGLDVSWSGSHTERIAVTIGDWRKPLPV